MNLRIDSFSASFNYQSVSFNSIVERLESEGYRPLIRKLATELCNVVGGNLDDLMNGTDLTEEAELELNSDVNRRKLLGLEKLGYKWGLDGIRGLARVPELKGELFLADDSENILLLTILDASMSKQAKKDGQSKTGMLRVGIVGANPDSVLLDLFKTDIATLLGENGDQIEWHVDQIENPQFKEFLDAEEHAIHALAAGITEREMKSAKVLETTGVRDVASAIRKSGVILAKELLRNNPDTASDTVKCVDQLIQADLLHQEYVVICSKSGAHVNRVEHRETIDQMSKLGVLCSCGKRIADEAIEGLLSTDALLPKMLDKNYWMTVSVVRSLMGLGISPEKILLNPSSLNDDVEILADLDGTLLMFNLKDTEFGIPHALSVTTRISMHKPSIAFLVSTLGISNDVKEHFKRVKLDTQVVYIPTLTQLDGTLKKVVEGIRMLRVKTWLETFQTMMNFGLAPLLIQRLQSAKSEQEAKPSPAASLMDSIKSKTRQTLHEVPVMKPPQPEMQVQPQPQLQPMPEVVIPAPVAAAVEMPQAPVESPVYTAPEPITETLETSYSHHEHDQDHEVATEPVQHVQPVQLVEPVEQFQSVQEVAQAPIVEPVAEAMPVYAEPAPVQSTLPTTPAFSMPQPQADISPAAMFAHSPFGDDDEVSDSAVAVSELEELISEAKESKISSGMEHVTQPKSGIDYFADETNAVNHDAPAVPTPVVNPYKRVMEMLNPQPQVVTSVIIDDTVEKAAPSAMDILDNVIEAVAATENTAPVAAQPVPAASSGNIFTEQYMNYAARAAAQQSTDEEQEQPVPTF
ncbi:MAG TPA: hypothetical protein V6C86_13785 [Oculatellaceae cyanobacterium]